MCRDLLEQVKEKEKQVAKTMKKLKEPKKCKRDV